MKKIIILTILVIVGMLCQAQKTQPDVCMPYRVAKNIVVELVSCDSAKQILNLKEKQLVAAKQKMAYQDSVIATRDSYIDYINKQFQDQVGITTATNKLYYDLEKQYNTTYKKYNSSKRLSRTLAIGALVLVSVVCVVK